MSIRYYEYQLLELFEAEPEVLSEEDQIFSYFKKQDSYGLEFRLILADYAGICGISLGYKGSLLCVFDIELCGVKRVYIEDEELIIKSSNSEEIVSVLFKPMFSLQRLKWKDYSFSSGEREQA